ncbi:MAG TPA: DUF72 domain-containing protein [Paraburkholderia sp.]|jgi:uncharacterized protein YecE (DUF72 family)
MVRSLASRIRIGVGGWSYEPWRGPFYPDGLAQRRELEYASRQLTSIEINSTFYGAQRAESFARWHDETPDDFVFSVKAPRFATHRKVLADAGASIARFVEGGLTRLGTKLGPINWQFDPRKPFEADDFARFLELLPAQADGLRLRHALEVRHDSFRTPEFVALAQKHDAAIVIAGDSRYPQIADTTAPFVYVRIMGTTSAQPLGYAPAELDQWAARALAWAAGNAPDDLATLAPASASKAGRDVFLYVISGHKVSNPAAAMALFERVRA